MRLNLYRVTLESDSGKVRITTTAGSKKEAGRIVCKCEHAPTSAICTVKYLKTVYKGATK